VVLAEDVARQAAEPLAARTLFVHGGDGRLGRDPRPVGPQLDVIDDRLAGVGRLLGADANADDRQRRFTDLAGH
jgi:hypothetical protein